MKGGVGSMCMGGSGGRVEVVSHMGVGGVGSMCMGGSGGRVEGGGVTWAWGSGEHGGEWWQGGRGESHGRGGVGNMCMGGSGWQGGVFFLLNNFS